jgi:hypothetical protein
MQEKANRVHLLCAFAAGAGAGSYIEKPNTILSKCHSVVLVKGRQIKETFLFFIFMIRIFLFKHYSVMVLEVYIEKPKSLVSSFRTVKLVNDT